MERRLRAAWHRRYCSPMPALDPLPPDPDQLNPLADHPGLVFLRPLLLARHPGIRNVAIGAYSYYDDQDGGALRFFQRNLRYNFGFSGSRLVIGRYCALAHGCTIVMDDANHALAGPSSFPFAIFGGAWAAAMPIEEMPVERRGDTVIGNDVWLGYESLVLPGVTIGDGAVVAARSVVSRDVPPYSVVAGNPARVVRVRYDEPEVERLLRLAWWNWPVARVTAAVPLLVAGDVDGLEALAPDRPR